MKKFILIVLTLALAACTGSVSDTDIRWAQKTCEPREGINYLTPEGLYTYPYVVCNDGMVIRRHRSPVVQ